MKKILTNEIATNKRQPFSKRSIEHLQEAFQEALAHVLAGIMAPSLSDIVVLYGVTVTKAGQDFTCTAGAVVYNGEIFPVDAASFTAPVGQTGVFKIVETYRAGDPVEFSDNIFRNVHLVRNIKLEAGASGSGIKDYNAITSIKTVQGTLTVPGSINVNTNNVTGGGINLSADGDIVDLNDGYVAIRFTNGVRIYSAKSAGSVVITLDKNGHIVAIGNISGTNGSFSGTLTIGGNASISGTITSPTISNLNSSLNTLETNKADKTQPAWLTPSLGTGWSIGVNLYGQAPLRYRKNSLGKVELKGAVANTLGGANANPVFTLPAGYRPADGTRTFITYSGSAGDGDNYLDVKTDGVIESINTPGGGLIALDGVEFWPD